MAFPLIYQITISSILFMLLVGRFYNEYNDYQQRLLEHGPANNDAIDQRNRLENNEGVQSEMP